MRPDYDRAALSTGTRGRHFAEYQAGTNVAFLAPDENRAVNDPTAPHCRAVNDPSDEPLLRMTLANWSATGTTG